MLPIIARYKRKRWLKRCIDRNNIALASHLNNQSVRSTGKRPLPPSLWKFASSPRRRASRTDFHDGAPRDVPARGTRLSIMRPAPESQTERGLTCGREPAMPTPRAKGPPSRHYPLVGLLDSESRAVQSRGNNDTLALVSFTENASECLRYSSSLWGPAAPPVGPRALRVWEPRDTIPSAGAFVKWLSSPSPPPLSLSSLSLILSGWVRQRW